MTLTDSESLILVIPALNFLLGTSITSMPMSAIRMTARSKRADKLERKEAASECILLLSICVIREQLLLSWRRLVSLGTLRGAQVLQGLTSESSPARKASSSLLSELTNSALPMLKSNAETKKSLSSAMQNLAHAAEYYLQVCY